MREINEYIVNCKADIQRRNGGVTEQRSYKDITNEHNPLELGPPQSRLVRAVSKPSTLHAVVVFVVGSGHTGLVGLEGFATTALFADPWEIFSIPFPRDETCAELGREIVHG